MNLPEIELGATIDPGPAIQATHIKVLTGRIVCNLSLPLPDLRYSNRQLASNLIKEYPDLPYHACVNALGSSFASVIEHTSLPHVLEHLSISNQVRMTEVLSQVNEGSSQVLKQLKSLNTLQASGHFQQLNCQEVSAELTAYEVSAASRAFLGTSEWLDEQAGVARISLSYFDDLVALCSFNNALKFLNRIVLPYEV